MLLNTQIKGNKSKTGAAAASHKTDSAAPTSKLSRVKLTDEERKKLQEKIKKATSLDEILRLEKELNEGRLPAGIHGGDAMEE